MSRYAVFLCLVGTLVHAGKECVWIIGKVECQKDPTKNLNVEIRVLDRDSWGPLKIVDPDDLMGVTFSNEDGRFQLDGCGDDFDWIPGIKNTPEPYVQVRHYCNNAEGEIITLPEFSKFVPDTYEIGNIVLDKEMSADINPKLLATNIGVAPAEETVTVNKPN